MLNNIREECKGCQAVCRNYFKNYPIYVTYYGEVVATCPCINCLVKVTCRDICQAYYDFEKKRNELKSIKGKEPYRRVLGDGYVRTVLLFLEGNNK